MENFNPPFWLRSPHIQSILASSPMRKSVLRQQSSEWLKRSKSLLLQGHQGSQLLGYWTAAKTPQAPLVILIHGWEGTSQSGYLLSVANQLVSAGYQILRLNLRDHDASHHLNRELFHSCRIEEVVSAAQDALNRLAPTQAAVVGFSLGGNFTIRVANALSQDKRIKQAIAVCPVLIPQDTMHRLETGPRIYHQYFKRKWLRSIRKKSGLFPEDFKQLTPQHLKSLGSLTDYFVEHHTEYRSTNDYFEGYSIRPEKLERLTIPTKILMAKDDPIINAELLQQLEKVASIEVTYTQHGGHCGFIQNRRFDSWADRFILNSLQQALVFQ
ncbi:YheT family hydrolase [Pleionea litopenaei]|uniref:Alpha/beta fold hydrolase n=1 Tax=Pleionea litopenaei TaxID=3070815 RepID=A0AA51RQU7_9GAMM|nr:alpha/beta fold hydrolase [Pleionea sp. HL-JVS1]WMS85936.1 alpha/beta fold hydrolase [Pleionea sp. HL-JVS1]